MLSFPTIAQNDPHVCNANYINKVIIISLSSLQLNYMAIIYDKMINKININYLKKEKQKLITSCNKM